MAGTLTTGDLEAIWDRYQAGMTPVKIARDIGRDREATHPSGTGTRSGISRSVCSATHSLIRTRDGSGSSCSGSGSIPVPNHRRSVSS